jgi:putative nucleotidyltransferase with HDIG domain
MVLTIGIVDRFTGPSTSKYFDRGEFWEHSLSVAVASRQLVGRDPTVNPEEAHIAGLLHDIGKVIVDHSMPEKYSLAMKYIYEDGMDQLEAEREAIGLSHDEIGALVAVKWRFPEFMREVLAYHHRWDQAEEFKSMVEVVALANLIVLGFKEQELEGKDYSVPDVAPDLKSRWLPTPRHEEVFLTKYEADVERVRDIMRLFE